MKIWLICLASLLIATVPHASASGAGGCSHTGTFVSVGTVVGKTGECYDLSDTDIEYERCFDGNCESGLIRLA